ncbi:type IV secretion system protein VirB10 [Phyllobacterium sp. P30BS-XVII]|uniref:type IV secretion system protein VirB10 n=1 Tax=Phyllobacterium sp. P30BS-XVII TaxID=2587046 RepID=UPI0015F88A64|nr:type IV secretion system protein VirB10 [Phyllobacterium sp. P30BS-XVII]MBA8904141.1 type IV secretion system protein VirB10 [Phyllobacterium sp. P30BS-XVII]
MTIDFEREASIGETVAVKHTGRSNPLVAGLLVTVAIGALGYAAYTSYLKPAAKSDLTTNEEFRTASSAPNLSFSVPSLPVDNKLVIEPPPPVPEPVVAPVIAAPVVQIDDGAARRAAEEAERLRREEEARRLERLRSNMLVVDGSVGPGSGSLAGSAADASAAGMEGDEDANRRFLGRTAAQNVEMVDATQNHRIDALIPQGTLIRGILETAIQSDLPGMVRAVISSDIYSFDGRRVLLPKGTMLVGEYKSGLSRGQTRVMIVWTRALRADGTSISLGSYGTDDLGRSGVAGVVDKHYLERFGASAVLSIVGGVSSFVAGLNSNGSSNAGSGSNNNNNGATQAQQTISQTMSDMANQALKDSINIPPTIHIDQGTQIMVFVRRDLNFSSLYPDPVKEALYELRHPGSSRNPKGMR